MMIAGLVRAICLHRTKRNSDIVTLVRLNFRLLEEYNNQRGD
tara:strand:+ start:59 stop:184 length:126 start_codon:yes stop_codon:yes gene_type:complete